MPTHQEEIEQQQEAVDVAKENDEIAVVQCSTTAGTIIMEFYRDWSPHGYDKVVQLFEIKYYDESHFFRMVPGFLVQFGITYSKDPSVRQLGLKTIPDDPQWDPPIPFLPGTMSYAGSGPNSRSSQLFIAFGRGQLGTELWETAIGRVVDGFENVKNFYSGYGDMPPWGKGPVQQKIHNGPEYIESEFPKMDKFITCSVDRHQPHSDTHHEQGQKEQHTKEKAIANEARSSQTKDDATKLRHRQEEHADKIKLRKDLHSDTGAIPNRDEEGELSHIEGHNKHKHKQHHNHNKIHDSHHQHRSDADQSHVRLQQHHEHHLPPGHDTENHHHLKKIYHETGPLEGGLTIMSLELTTVCLLLFGGVLLIWLIYVLRGGNPKQRKTQ